MKRDEAGLRDGGITHHALQVGLRNGAQVAHQQRSRSHQGHDEFNGGQCGEGSQNDAEQGEAGHLGGHGEESRHWSGCALVYVRNPQLHGNRADFEGRAEQQHGEGQVHGGGRLARQRVADDGSVIDEGSRDAEVPGQAEDEEARADGAQNQVLDARFRGAQVPAEVAHHDEGAQGKHFQGDEQFHQVGGLAQGGDAHAGQQGKDVEFPRAVLGLGVVGREVDDGPEVHGQQQGDCRGDKRQDDVDVVIESPHVEGEHRQGTRRANQPEDEFGRLFAEGLGQEHKHRQAGQDEFRNIRLHG